MFCKKCGTQLKEGSKFCSNCGNCISDDDTKILNNSEINSDNIKKKTFKKIWIISILIIIAFVAGVIGIDIYKEIKLVNDVELWYEAFKSEQYVLAKEMACDLEEPYKSYYTDYTAFAIELENWTGTDEELCSWLERFFVHCEGKGYADIIFPDAVDSEYCVWNNVVVQQEVYNQQKEYILDAIQWQPEYRKTMEEYYTTMYKILWDNRELFKTPAINGEVWIPLSSAYEINSEAFRIYHVSDNALRKLEAEYTLAEMYTGVFETDFKKMEDLYGTYESSAVALINDGNEDGYIFFYEDTALDNYNKVTENYDLHIGYIDGLGQLESFENLNLYYLEEIYDCNISPVAYSLHDIIDNMFYCKFKISNAEWIDEIAIYEECFGE